MTRAPSQQLRSVAALAARGPAAFIRSCAPGVLQSVASLAARGPAAFIRSRAPGVLLLSVTSLAACGWRSEGVSVAVSAETVLQAPAHADASGLHWTAQDGTEVTVSRGFVTVSAIEIFPCPASALRRMWNELGLYGTAHAHTTSNPTRIGAPTVVSALQAPGVAATLGTLRPPVVRFCRVRVTLAPADEDAAALPDGVDMVGKTLWLDGTRTPPAGIPQPFHVESAGKVEIDLDVGPLTPTEANPELAVVVELAPARWLDGVELGGGGNPGPAALSAAAASTSAR